jgi:hypothetical protein
MAYPRNSQITLAGTLPVTVTLKIPPSNALGRQWVVLDSVTASVQWSTTANGAALVFSGTSVTAWQTAFGNGLATVPGNYSIAWPDNTGPRLNDTAPKLLIANVAGTPIAGSVNINVTYHFEQS